MKARIKKFCEKLETEFDQIDSVRKDLLLSLSDYISKKLKQNQTPKIIVVCTHNSRRSHFGQIWLSIGADYYVLPKVETYSGGTEATAFNVRSVLALQKIGIDIEVKANDANNPIYAMTWGVGKSCEAFSKKYDNAPNPKENFAVIMVCTEADEGCPVLLGCDFRLALPFEDPKVYDGTSQEGEKYSERCQQIGREMLFAMHNVKTT